METVEPGVRAPDQDRPERAFEQGGIRYACVWEDHSLLEDALEIGPEDDVIAIGSGGCNVFNLLLKQPRHLVAIDVNPAQTALLHLKTAAIRRLDRDRFACLLGLRSGWHRWQLYRSLRDGLPSEARSFWDRHRQLIEEGLLRCGAMERYVRAFQSGDLERLVGAETVARWLRMEDPSEQKSFFRDRFCIPELERCFCRHFGEGMIARRARLEEQYRFVGTMDIGAFAWERFTDACTRLQVRGNFYLEFFLTGTYRRLEFGPPYLRCESWLRLRAALERLSIVTGDLDGHLDGVPPGKYNKANLSDLPEYLSPRRYECLLRRLADRLRPGGRIAYWNLLVPRSRPPSLSHRLRSLPDLARSLWRRDRAWCYRAFRVEEVVRW